MKAIIFCTISCTVSAASVQEVVDILFDNYLPLKVSREEVKTCRANCNTDNDCLETCPKFACPFQRISMQCDRFNSSMVDAKVCHHACEHDFLCHVKCPMAKPTTMKELHVFAEAAVCHTQCGDDHACHKVCHETFNPWVEKQARCEKLHDVVMCMRSGESRSACPHLDEKTKAELMQEPWSLLKDIANHAVNYLLSLPKEQDVSVERVKSCHMQCGADVVCHRKCPKGAWGDFHDKCDMLEVASVCHKTCENSEIECPFKKMECHFQCPMSKPTSLEELKGLMDHVLCHTACNQNKSCHKACPNSNWSERKAQCKQYDEVVACHKRCAGDHSCHASCPHLQDQILSETKQEARTSVASDIPLVSFAPDAAPSLTHKWSALNDPVMGGQSYSTVSVSDGILNFTGKCAIVPFLKAPGFITAATGRGFGPGKVSPETFVDVSSCKGITIIARDYSNGYSGYRISFGNAHVSGTHHAYGFKADLHPTVGSFGSVSIPFSSFTDFWDDATGKPIHSCEENREYCPDEHTLTNMQTMSIWAEGVEGHVHLEVKSISGYSCTATMKERDNVIKDVIGDVLV